MSDFVYVFPAIGASVPFPTAGSPTNLSSTGSRTEVTDYILDQMLAGRLLTTDPFGGIMTGSSVPSQTLIGVLDGGAFVDARHYLNFRDNFSASIDHENERINVDIDVGNLTGNVSVFSGSGPSAFLTTTGLRFTGNGVTIASSSQGATVTIDGTGNPATNAPPSVSTANTLGSVTARFAREDHTHAFADVTTTTRGAMLAADKVLVNDRFAKEYVVQPGSWSVNGNGVGNDNNPINNLLSSTMQPQGGRARFTSGTYRMSAVGRMFPANVHCDFDGNALFDAEVLEYVFLGPVTAPPRGRIFRTNASSGVLLPGQTIHAEWFGAKADEVTDCEQPIFAALRSLQEFSASNPHTSGLVGGGGTLLFQDTSKEYRLSGSIALTGAIDYSRLSIRGPGVVRHSTDRALIDHATTPFIHITGNSSYRILNDLRISDITFRCNGSEDYSQCLFFGSVNRVWIDGVRIQDNAKEGIHFADPRNCTDVKITRCSAENNGRYGTGGSEPVAAYNPNASQLILSLNTAYNAGQFIEQTGDDFVCTSNVFRLARFRGIMLQSARHNSEKAVVANNILSHAPAGIFVADQGNSLGKVIIADNVIYDCSQSINVGSDTGHEALVTNNYCLGGDVGSEAVFVGRGANVVMGNVVSRVTGTCLGSISSGSRTLTVLTGSGLSRGCYLTITGVSGTKYVENDLWNPPNVLYTLDEPSNATVSSAAVTYETDKWGYAFRCDNDDFFTIRNNFILGVPWNTSCFRLKQGVRGTVGPNVLEPKGESYGNLTVLSVIDPNNGTAASLKADQFDPTREWVYSGFREQSRFWANAWPTGSGLTWKEGDVMHHTAPTGSGHMGQVVVTAGTDGTLLNVSGSITSGSTALALTTATGLYAGSYVTIAGVTGKRRILWLNTTGATLDSASDATVSNAPMSFSPTTRRLWGPIA